MTVTETIFTELQRRVKLGDSLNQIEESCEIGKGSLSRFMRGQRSISGATIDEVADFLGLELRKKK